MDGIVNKKENAGKVSHLDSSFEERLEVDTFFCLATTFLFYLTLFSISSIPILTINQETSLSIKVNLKFDKNKDTHPKVY